MHIQNNKVCRCHRPTNKIQWDHDSCIHYLLPASVSRVLPAVRKGVLVAPEELDVSEIYQAIFGLNDLHL